MKIVIDAHMVGHRETGNETYVLGLLRGLTEVDLCNQYFVLVTNPDALCSKVDLPTNFTLVPLRFAANAVRIPLAMPWIVHRLGADALHVTYIAPPICPSPVVVTVHDISFKMFPHFFSRRDRLVLSNFVPLSMRKATRVIADSHCTATDIVTHYGLPKEKIAIIPLAADQRFSPVRDTAKLKAVREKYNLADKFILTVANLQPRKNLRVLLDAIAELKSGQVPRVQVVIAGQPHWKAHEIIEQVQLAELEDNVRILGYVPDEDLPTLYSAACAFAFPSIYEGFGLPPLEAMACGTPVVASNSSSLEEVVGDAGLLLPPYSVKAWADALQSLLENPMLRQELAQRGIAQASKFSWHNTAKETLKVYKKVRGTPNPMHRS